VESRCCSGTGEFYLFAQMVNHRQRGKPQSAFLPQPSKAELQKSTLQDDCCRCCCVCFAARKTPLWASFQLQSRFTQKLLEQRAAFLEEQYHPLFKLLCMVYFCSCAIIQDKRGIIFTSMLLLELQPCWNQQWF
jgi:hypothetical protein